MNFNCTDIILALDQTWSNHSSLLHIPKTFSEEIPCQCRFFSEVSRMGKCTDLSLKCHEHGWTRIILITIQILSPKLPWQKKTITTNQSTAEFWTLEVLRCLNPLLHCISSNWPPEKSWPAMDIRFSSMTFCVNLAMGITTGHWCEIHPNFWKKTTKNQNKQAGITSPFCRRKHKRLDLARDTSSLDFTRMSWMEIRDVNSLP